MKQLKVDFATTNDKLPSNYNSLILSFIKAAVKKYDPQSYDEWFNKTRNASELQKSYTFSCYIPEARFDRNSLILPQKCFSLYLSTYDIRDLMVLYNSLLGMLRIAYPAAGNTITSTSIQTLPVQEIISNRIAIKIDSAMLVRSHDRERNRDRFLAFNDELFAVSLQEIVALSLERNRLNLNLDGFAIRPINARKTVISYFNDMKVTANMGVFQLEGEPSLLNYLLLSGLGSATGSGHGKFHVVG